MIYLTATLTIAMLAGVAIANTFSYPYSPKPRINSPATMRRYRKMFKA